MVIKVEETHGTERGLQGISALSYVRLLDAMSVYLIVWIELHFSLVSSETTISNMGMYMCVCMYICKWRAKFVPVFAPRSPRSILLVRVISHTVRMKHRICYWGVLAVA